MLLLKSFVQEDEDDEYEEEKSPMEDTMDPTDNEEDSNENDEKIIIGKKTHQVSLDFNIIHKNSQRAKPVVKHQEARIHLWTINT